MKRNPPHYYGKDHPSWKGNKITNITWLHTWLRNNYGFADHCENPSCEDESDCFDWSMLHNKKGDNRRAWFIQLCRSCHLTYDYTPERNKKKRRAMQKFWRKNSKLRARYRKDFKGRKITWTQEILKSRKIGKKKMKKRNNIISGLKKIT